MTMDDDTHNVGIGTTTPDAPLQVVHATNATLEVGPGSGGLLSYMTINKPSAALVTGIFRARDDGNTMVVIDQASATYQLTIYGDAYASGGTWTNSDRRIKTDINDLSSALSNIMKLKPSTYYFDTKNKEYQYLNLPEEQQFGLIAQDVKKIFPNIVREDKKYDEAGNLRPETVHSVNYTELIPVLIKGMQEQQQQIQDLMNQIEQLKNR